MRTDKVIYIDLDSLLDTRLGTLIQINEIAAIEALDNGYHARISDDWSKLTPNINQAEYNSRYKTRDIETLKVSRCTNAVPIINELSKSLIEAAIYTPEVSSVAVEVNLYPYKLSSDEVKMIEDVVRYYLSVNTNIKTTYLTPEQLTPDVIYLHYDGLIMYDFNAWIVSQVERLKEKRLPTVTIMAPALYANKIPDKDEITFEDTGEISPFASLELVLCEYVDLHLLDAKYFSLIVPE